MAEIQHSVAKMIARMGNAVGNKQKAIMKAIVSNPSAMPAK